MGKISLYVLLILFYLALEKSFSPSEYNTPYIINEKSFAHIFPGAPMSVILIDSFQTGFILKTYYQKYKVFHGFSRPEEILVRTNRDFWRKNLNNLGLSLFSRAESQQSFTTPLPAGSLYIGKSSYGQWRFDSSGKRSWEFYRAYQHFPLVFHWGDFRPSYEFYTQLKLHQKNNTAFYGLNNEFGTKGSITSRFLQNTLSLRQEHELTLSEYLAQRFQIKTLPYPM